MATVEIFSSPRCGYCIRSKELLTGEGVAFIDCDVSLPEHREEFVRRLPRVRTVPQIFIDGLHIGGFEDLQIRQKNGSLSELLSA